MGLLGCGSIGVVPMSLQDRRGVEAQRAMASKVELETFSRLIG